MPDVYGSPMEGMNDSPHLLSPLFEDVQTQQILDDGKTFVDCEPKRNSQEILTDYLRIRSQAGFNLKRFVEENFRVPQIHDEVVTDSQRKPILDHIQSLWTVLSRQPSHSRGSLIGLPNPYVVPGGRFREIYYWDSYFTMLGLRASDRMDLVRGMIGNFAWLISQFGYIPNGNRSYFLGRSQPPFFSMMVALLPEKEQAQYRTHLIQEHRFWTSGGRQVLAGGFHVSRYWDEMDQPRPESYREDVELAHQSEQSPAVLYRHLRAAAESGWDFSSRWFRHDTDFSSIHTTEIMPVDLNCLLYHLEQHLARLHDVDGQHAEAIKYSSSADLRRKAIIALCWSEVDGFFYDFDFVAGQQKQIATLAGVFPLFTGIATEEQAHRCAAFVEKTFLRHGGLTTTVVNSGQQWDAPNGWAPLQWVAYDGLKRYGHRTLANEIRRRWMNTLESVYQRTGKLTEKYDVYSEDGAASGGEYPNQDGFGWTNGVYAAMAKGEEK